MKSLKLNNNYKAIIFDVDGTLIPNKEDGKPSKKVKEAVNKAQKILNVSIASARPSFLISHIFDALELKGPQIIFDGAQIVDVETGKIFYEQPVEQKSVDKICEIISSHGFTPFIADTNYNQFYEKKGLIEKPMNIFASSVSPQKAEKLISDLSKIPTINVHKIPAWEKGKVFVCASHAKATKQHAVLEYARILGINTHEIIAVGDGYNDFPLFMAAGFRVAMGNAVEDLKVIADYIAPAVEEDGVVDIIEKFIFKK